MKISELIDLDKQLQEDINDEDTCSLCAVHEAAHRQLKEELYCPHCGKPQNLIDHNQYGESCLSFDDYVPVGDWYADLDEDIRMWPIVQCRECGKEYALVPMLIHHNYNHGVYYTARKHVLPQFSENDFIQKILPYVTEYLNRYTKESGLQPEHLARWLSRDMEKYICELLDKNYKDVI